MQQRSVAIVFSTGMMTNFLANHPWPGKGPNILESDNNGLLFTADLLEEIYTNPNFPFNIPYKLNVSMKDSGKSRADLWAFAGTFYNWHYKAQTL